MTKDETMQNVNTQQSNGSMHRSNFSGAPRAHTKAILKIKQADKNDCQIKTTFTDNEGNQVNELIPTSETATQENFFSSSKKNCSSLDLVTIFFKTDVGNFSAKSADER